MFRFGISCFFVMVFIAGMMSCKKENKNALEKGVSFELNEYRKKSIDSIHYELELDVPVLKKDAIRGKIAVSFHLNSLKQPVVLDFSRDKSQVLSVTSKEKKIDFQFENEHIVIDNEVFKEGKNQIEIEFVAGDMSLNRSDEYLYTLFVPDRASTCFPLFDQPNLKATYSLTLKTPSSWEAVSNGALKNKQTQGEKSVYQFEKTKPISSYLFAFATGKFFKQTQTIKGREMTMYYRETDTLKVKRNKDEVFHLHAASIEWLEDYTDIPYPFGKFDFVLLPSFQYGGMEHPGSIFYNEAALFLDENASVNKRLSRASVIAHESAHMWFGDLVTMDWFNDVWLKEVFANFMAAKIVNPSFPEINFDLRFLLSHYPSAYDVDRSKGSNPIWQPLTNLKNAGTLYGAIIYLKAPIVMRHLERKIGEKMFQESLQDYLHAFSFGNARWDDLVKIIDKKTTLDIEQWSNVWVKTSGMPEYDLAATQQNISIAQKKDSVSGRIWQQSFNAKWKDGAQFQQSLLNIVNAKSLVITAKSDVVFPNSTGIGYGYFEMDSTSRDYFFQNYNSGKVSGLNEPLLRGSVLVNVWEGFLRGNGPTPSVLLKDLMKALPLEKDPLLVDYILGNIQSVWWNFLTEESRNSYQSDLEGLLWKLLNTTTDKGTKTSYLRSFRNISLTPDAIAKLTSLWNEELKIKDLVLSEDDKIGLASDIALKGQGDEKVVLEKQLSQIKNPDRKQKMQFVMPALSKDEKVRDAFFESLKKPENREKEAWVLEGIGYLNHPLRQKSALKYLRPSLDLLEEIQLTGDIFFPTRWTNTTFSGHSSPEAQKIKDQFLAEHADYPYFLKNKILQATDILDRAVVLKR